LVTDQAAAAAATGATGGVMLKMNRRRRRRRRRSMTITQDLKMDSLHHHQLHQAGISVLRILLANFEIIVTSRGSVLMMMLK
jgi:hypothetical protein